MGEVYRGVDTRLGRAVALKVISQRLVGDEGSRRRFETEARAASALNHPAIVTIYDIGEGDGLSWIAMELVEGRTLREAIADGPLSIRQAWSIARQLAEGLAAAHAKGIVHRDLKQENVMLTHEGGVKILDFGVARQVAPASARGSSLATATDVGTMAGAILGTVGYMSPEQATRRNVDFRSDQFSFGAVIYELLAGQRAFHRPTAVETLSAILRDEPPPLASNRADAPDALQRVIGRCLEKAPEQRFASTRELATALALMPEASTSVASSGTALPDPATAPPRRRTLTRLRLAVLAAVALAVASGAFLWSRRDGTAPPPLTSVAVLPFESSPPDPDIEYIADGLTEGLIDHLARARSLKVQARATVMRLKGNPNPQEAARALGVGAVVTGALSRRGTQIVVSAELIDGATGERLWGQKFDRPLADLMRVQDTIVLSIAEGLQLRLSGEEKARLGGFGTDNPEAYELFLKGRFLMQRETEEDDLEALRLFKLAAEKDPNFLDAHLAVANSYGRMVGGGLLSSRDAGGHADEALAKAFAIDRNNAGVRMAMAGRRFVTKHDWAAAEREYRAVMDEPTILRSSQWHPIALFFVAIGRPDEAAALAERALVVDPGNLESRAMLGNFLKQAGRFDQAMETYEKLAAEEPEDSRPLFGIADVYRRRGDVARAAEARRKAYVIDDREDAAQAFAGATTEAEYAKAELAVARAELRDLQDLSKHRFVSPLDIARLHAQVGNREEALALLERATDEDMTGLSLLKVDQDWESVRADPRFAAVVRRIGIP